MMHPSLYIGCRISNSLPAITQCAGAPQQRFQQPVPWRCSRVRGLEFTCLSQSITILVVCLQHGQCWPRHWPTHYKFRKSNRPRHDVLCLINSAHLVPTPAACRTNNRQHQRSTVATPHGSRLDSGVQIADNHRSSPASSVVTDDNSATSATLPTHRQLKHANDDFEGRTPRVSERPDSATVDMPHSHQQPYLQPTPDSKLNWQHHHP